MGEIHHAFQPFDDDNTGKISLRQYLLWLGKQKSFLDDLASLDPDRYQGLIFLKHYAGNPESPSLNFTVTVEDATLAPPSTPRLTPPPNSQISALRRPSTSFPTVAT
jgi:hypothetical protein